MKQSKPRFKSYIWNGGVNGDRYVTKCIKSCMEVRVTAPQKQYVANHIEYCDSIVVQW